MFGVSKDGFRRKKYTDIVESMQGKAVDVFGEDINLNNNSFLGMLITVTAWAISLVWELAEKVFFSKYVDYAEGNNLDLATRNYGITRLGASKAHGMVTFNRVAPKGALVASDSLVFETLETGTEVNIVALEGGYKYNLPSNAIDKINTPVPNLEILSSSETIDGLDAETDAELRTRFYASFASAGASTVDSIIASLLRTEGVTAANVEEVEEGDYYKGIRAITLGGSKDNIAQALLDYKAFGIKTFGEQSGLAIADNGDEYILNFDYATEKLIDVNIEVTTGNNYPSEGDNEVIKVISEYIKSLSMGEDVIYSQVIMSSFKVPGVIDVDVNLNGAKANVAIGTDEVATVGGVVVT